MTDLILHERTEAKLAAVRAHLPHALLLSGDTGVGLAAIARDLAGDELATLIEPVDRKGSIDHDSGTISVATIRALYEQTKSKSLTRQVYIIDDADRMSPGASAAFLKLLEEPTDSTHFILTTHVPQMLLPTVRSRLQIITVDPVSSEQTKEQIRTLHIRDQHTMAQLEYLATGLPAELIRLTADTDYFTERAKTMADTKVLLTGSLYQKIIIAHAYQQSRPRALQLLDSALAITKRSLMTQPQPRTAKQLSALLSTRERIEANGNIRLQLLAFVIQ